MGCCYATLVLIQSQSLRWLQRTWCDSLRHVYASLIFSVSDNHRHFWILFFQSALRIGGLKSHRDRTFILTISPHLLTTDFPTRVALPS